MLLLVSAGWWFVKITEMHIWTNYCMITIIANDGVNFVIKLMQAYQLISCIVFLAIRMDQDRVLTKQWMPLLSLEVIGVSLSRSLTKSKLSTFVGPNLTTRTIH